MRSLFDSLKFALFTTTSVASIILAGELPTEAATFSNSSAFLRIDRFSIAPQNPDADSNRDAIAFTGDDKSIADANGDGTLNFTINEDNTNDTFLKLDFTSNSLGNGTDYFSLGQSSSIANSIFFLESNDTLSFNFTVSLTLSNIVDSKLDGSVNSFTGVSFALFDELNDIFLGEFRAIGNLDTNLINGINNDLIFAESSLDFTIDSFNDEQLFGGDREFASIDVVGSIQQFVTTPTQIRLEANSFNLSCTQGIQTSNPCIRTVVSESNNTIGSILAFLAIILLSKKINKKDS